jgi:SHS2 domain-containing protein
VQLELEELKRWLEMIEASHKFLDHTADVLFVAQGPTLNELFEQCALALEETQVNLSNVVESKQVRIKGKAKRIDSLLFDFLDDLVFQKDAEQLIFKKFDISIKEQDNHFILSCIAHGEKLDNDKHEPKVDVKAITMHMFEVKEIDQGWSATVLVDI